jgi:UDP-3-O-[3-hydroxymyristoyl] N-acetylglucosamine deacetylase/3-hydroxyacyl-[acyl-carrier-protein] dehydratase
MAVLFGLGVDNLNIELDNSEVPGLDGSGLNFLEAILQVGLSQQDKAKSFYAIKEPLFAQEQDAAIIVLPSQDFKISYTLDYNHPLLKTEFMDLVLTPQVFTEEIASARTFCLEEEAGQLQRQGIGCGANYQNTLVVGKDGVIKNKLRYPNEFIRHKILDLIGDLYLVGVPLKAHIIALKSGHSLNLKLVKKIYQQYERFSSAGVGTNSGFKAEGELDTEGIKKILPHREPFLFVDKIVRLEEGRRATGIKNISPSDYFFKGHFPGRPVMPGVLIVESMAQVGGVMMLSPQENRGKLAFFLSADNIKFRKTVLPGDQLVLEVVAGRIKSKTGQVHGQAFVDGKLVAEADLMFALVET